MPTAKSILIVDDEQNLRESLAMILQREGYVVTTTANANETHRLLQTCAFDLIFLDIKMPEKNGLTLLSEIRESHPDMSVIFLTAFASLDSAIEAVRQGADDYLLKPIDPPQILKRINQVLEKQKQPLRRKKIVDEMRGLLAELTQIEGVEYPSQSSFQDMRVIAIDPARYLQKGSITLDMHIRQVNVNGETLSLTPTAFDYLATLMRHSPKTVAYKTLVQESQGYNPTLIEAKEVTRWRIHELRKVIEIDSRKPQFIITVREIGYRLVT